VCFIGKAAGGTLVACLVNAMPQAARRLVSNPKQFIAINADGAPSWATFSVVPVAYAYAAASNNPPGIGEASR